MASAYEAAGVDYDTLDAAKRFAIDLASSTLRQPEARGAKVVSESIGEPASLIEIGGLRLAVVLECLGTKSMIARDVEEVLGLDRFEAVGTDAVAAIVNDLCCVGALPLTVNAYFATGSAEWYSGTRHRSLALGWARACESVGAAWVGGESPTLSGLVDARQIDLAGSALGRVPAGNEPWLSTSLRAGDEIVLVASSGLHANGASLARAVASSPDKCPHGWATALPSGRSYGEAVLDPSVLYSRLVEALLEARVPVHYASHVTGHGFRKLMRAPQSFTYKISRVMAVPEVLSFLVDSAGLSPHEAYGTLNMGVGFALFVEAGSGHGCVEVALASGFEAVVGGVVTQGERRVLIEPLGIAFESSELELR